MQLLNQQSMVRAVLSSAALIGPFSVRFLRSANLRMPLLTCALPPPLPVDIPIGNGML